MSLIVPGFTFSHERLAGINLANFQDSFDRLAPDQHLEGHYRYRHYSRCIYVSGRLKVVDNLPFYQSKKLNQLTGGVKRQFEPLDEQLLDLPELRQLIQTVTDYFGSNPETTILGIHQIRILCSTDEKGCPAPEGIHQDGFDLIAICCIDRNNIMGGESQIFSDPESDAVYKGTLEPGEVIYCNDRLMYHYASPLYPAVSGTKGHRDIFVITVNLGEEQWKQAAINSTPLLSESNSPHLRA